MQLLCLVIYFNTLKMKFTLAHTICNQDPQKCVQDVEQFSKDKKEVRVRFDTTVIVIGVKPVSGLIVGNNQQGGVPILAVVTSSLITWQGTKQDLENWETERVELHKKTLA